MSTPQLCPCQGLKLLNQWINYHLPDKVPLSPVNDPSTWVTYDQAIAKGLPAGFVFTPADQYFFVDIDNCIGPGWSYSPLALDILTWLRGCAVEVSQSGAGLHIFGRIPHAVPHACKNTGLRIEFYTDSRYVAFTGNFLPGTGTADHMIDPETYQAFIDTYFPPAVPPVQQPPAVPPVQTMNDDELISKAMVSESAKSIIRNGPAFRDLWTANLPQGFDWSSADMQLCNQLAFWCNKDTKQMKRLWGMSALGQRDKFRDRPDYVDRTVKEACIYVANTLAKKEEQNNGLVVLHPEDQKKHFDGCVLIRSSSGTPTVFVPGSGVTSASTFKATKGRALFVTDVNGQKTTKDAWEAFTNSQVFCPPEAHNVCFKPNLGYGQIITNDVGQQLVNIYKPASPKLKQGDPGPFIDLITRVLPDENDRNILLNYAAYIVQHPGEKFRWAPVLQGTNGNGKSLIAQIIANAVGQQYKYVIRPCDIANKFNGWLKYKLFIYANEMRKKKDVDIIGEMNELVGDSDTPMENKGEMATCDIENMANFLFCMNQKDAIKKHKDDRRFAVFYTPQQSKEDLTRDGMSGTYFPKFVKWLKTDGYAITAWFLRTYPVPEWFNPIDVPRAPDTSCVAQVVADARSQAANYLADAIEENRQGFRGGWISTRIFNDIMIAETGRKIDPRKMPQVMAEIGYVKCRKLTRMIPNEGGSQSYVYVVEGHPALSIQDGLIVTQMYCRDQGYPEVI